MHTQPLFSALQQQQAEQLGIDVSYYDIDGHLFYANPDTLDYFIHLLQPTGERLDGEFDDVVVINESEPQIYNFSSLSDTTAHSLLPIRYQLFDQQHQLIQTSHSTQLSAVNLPALAYGYYELIFTGEHSWRVRLLVQPKTSYRSPVLNNKKAWGINVQLYSLRSAQNWGIGDFGDLRFLIEQSVRLGADFIGINPLHLLYPAEPEWASPYSSSSRRWINPIYLAIPLLPEFKLCKSVQHWFTQQQDRLAQLRSEEWVDYQTVNQLKLEALRQLYAYFKRSKAKVMLQRQQAFEQFVNKEGNELLYQGLFNVLDSQANHPKIEKESKVGRLGWDNGLQKLNPPQCEALILEHYDDVLFYAWLQWLCNEQLSALQQYCIEQHMPLGIYGDLAVNSSRGGADVWSDQALYLTQSSIGAPPDPLGPIGQNWNLPPYNPTVLKNRGFQPFIDILRANMKHYGVLRIDHITGLFRLWLIPENKTASDGVYVHYPFEQLMAILAIESQRNHCVIVGEDLGTVPNEVRDKLATLQIFSYFVLYFAQKNQQYPAVQDFPYNAFATIGTHDVVSLASFWHCRDLELMAQLGILENESLQQKYTQRVVDKQALLDRLHLDNYLPADYQGDALTMAMHDHLNQMIHQYLAHSQSQLIGVQLENLLGQELSFNLPGTANEYPNWRKKLSLTLQQIFSEPYFIQFLTQINQARQQ